MKILIAEDEYYARERLAKIIREGDEGLELAAAVENGRQAVEILEQHTDIGIVVTDVIMPVMGGLELAGYIHENMPYIQVVIVSGYEEFDYARRAMEYEVKQYLVKPVRREQVIGTLKGLAEKQRQLMREMEERVRERLASIPSQYLSAKQLLGSAALADAHVPGFARVPEQSACCVLVVQKETAISGEEARCIERAAGSRTREPVRAGGIFCRTADEYIILLWEERGECLDRREAERTAADLLHYLQVQLRDRITIGVSSVFQKGEREIYEAYKECLYAMNTRLLQGWNRIYSYFPAQETGSYFGAGEENALYSALQMADAERALGLLHELLYKKELLESGDVNAYYDMILGILKTASRCYRTLCEGAEAGKSRVEIMFSRRYDLYSFKRPEALEAYLGDILRELCSMGQTAARPGGTAIIQDILQYVEHNYQYDLSLQELAEKKYFINSSYLSRLFKNVAGKTFSRYVIELRIEKARELLRNREIKINEIADQVGYNNASHFIQSFKKVCGCTPEEYRAKMLP